MALKATIYKADLQIADMDRNYYQEHTLTIARHPSETDERMMIRLLAFALHADPALAFTKDLFDVDEPALWQKDLTGAIQTWIEVGQPDGLRPRRARAGVQLQRDQPHLVQADRKQGGAGQEPVDREHP
jgi:uncharacterized protein YaeQ